MQPIGRTKYVENYYLLCQQVSKMCHVSCFCKVVLSLLKNLFFTIARPRIEYCIYNCTTKVSRPMFSGSKIIKRPFLG